MVHRHHLAVLWCCILLAGVLAGGCMNIPATTSPANPEIRKFNSTAEIEEYLRNSMAYASQDAMYRTVVPTTAWTGSLSKAEARTDQASGTGIPAPAIPGMADYSRTNVQVVGVDEPDIVKNDDRYIYTISGQNLVIIDAYPAERASVVSVTEISDTPRDIFVYGDRLVLFSTGTHEVDPRTIGEDIDGKSMPVPPYYRFSPPVTHATIYNIRERAKPQVIRDYSIEGDYLDARMIGSLLYLVTQEYVYPYCDAPVTVPLLREGTKTVVRPDVWYFDNPESQYTFTTITALDVATGNERDAQTYLLGSENTLYVSKDAIYVSYPRYRPAIYRVQEDLPLRSVAAGGSIGPSSVITADFNTLPAEERESILESLRRGEEDAVRRQEADQTTTVIHKIGIKDGAITYRAKGEVPGTLHNQFSMDEYGGNLRVATTSSVYSRRFGQYTYNNVFVLDSNMKTIGGLTHIAEQETIYATRFIGDKLYMVTFRRIDPLFVIDLSDPERPKVLGKLKIPGYSDYLHPYDATHIIGIGKETATNDWGGVSTSGVKLALFDISDLENPRLIDKVQIGDAGSDSAALSDHHAFLFDKAKNLLVIPIRAVTAEPVVKGDSFSPYPRVWYGAYVFGLFPETGFCLRGTVQHGSGEGGYYSTVMTPSSEVKRSLTIDNVLYTISGKQVKANPLDNLSTTLAKIPLPPAGDIHYPTVVK
ncbi:MAG: beta-propeller domain-containing protein [Methanolinea sp.]|nr:beta-propeller domain-containing protein [Methanolinea sp.]